MGTKSVSVQQKPPSILLLKVGTKKFRSVTPFPRLFFLKVGTKNSVLSSRSGASVSVSVSGKQKPPPPSPFFFIERWAKRIVSDPLVQLLICGIHHPTILPLKGGHRVPGHPNHLPSPCFLSKVGTKIEKGFAIYRSLHLPLLLSTNLLPSTHHSINPFSITHLLPSIYPQPIFNSIHPSIYPSSHLFILPSTYISICQFFHLSLFHLTSFPPFPSSILPSFLHSILPSFFYHFKVLYPCYRHAHKPFF
jgi:hypothetical protein